MVATGYRRITAEVDQRNYIAKKFFLSCGFLLESTLRKHRIVNNRNSDSSLFVLLNNEWREKELGIRRNLKMVPKKTVKASEIADIQQDLKEIQQLRSKKKNKKRKKH